MAKEKVLIIGASGFIGRHLFAYFSGRDYQVLGTQHSSQRPGLITFDLLKDRIGEKIPPSFFTGSRVFAVICSAISKIDRCLVQREVSYQVNVEKTVLLMEDLANKKVKSIFLSSDNVYDGKTGYYSELDKTEPVNEYGRQKLAVESYLKSNLKEGLTLRLSKIVGDDPAEEHIFSEWLDLSIRNKPVLCIRNQVFSPTFVEDIARGVELCCKNDFCGVYNMANQEFFSREDLAGLFTAVMQRNMEIISQEQMEFGFQDLRAERTYMDSSRFINATGMKFTTMQEVLKNFSEKAKAYAKVKQPF